MGLPLPNGEILDVTKLTASEDHKLNVAIMTISLFDRVENTVGKVENAGFQHFLLFPQSFRKASLSGSLKVGIVWYRIKWINLGVTDVNQLKVQNLENAV